jgi:phosphatidylglycerophosphate synthase
MVENGRKIESSIESPIDNLIISAIEIMAPFFNMLNITPNILTTISLLLSIYGVYHISIKNYKYGAILTFVGYIFDCCDGYCARRYSLGSQFGDLYDHMADIFKMLFLVAVLLKSDIKYKTKVLFISVFLVFTMLSNTYLGCLEQHTGTDCILSPLKMLCPNKSYIKYLRFTGTGTYFMVLSLFIYNMEAIDNMM